MQLCYIHFYQKIARKKVARVNAALRPIFMHSLLFLLLSNYHQKLNDIQYLKHSWV